MKVNQAIIDLARGRAWASVLLGLVVLLCGCESKKGAAQMRFRSVFAPEVVETQTGIASLYWQGSRTASGERFNPNGMTGAHRKWPFGTMVRVTNLNTGRHVMVRINDRGPFTRGRIIDLTPPAAKAIGFDRRMGVARVKIERMK